MSRELTERLPAPAAHRRPRVELTHYGALDGLRGVAVAAVLLYHGGVGWAQGGFLGVEVFFVLSGFLITSLLLAEWSRTATIRLGAFWARRARRLLPALFCLVAVIGLYYAVAGSAQAIPGLKGDGISALTYYSNWHQIAAGSSYFAATGPVSPLEHTWSLAIEEQFYVVWPILVGGVLWLAGRGARRSGAGGDAAPANRRPLLVVFGVTVAGAIASVVDTAILFDGGRNLDRVYYGTDTRASGLLIGAALAIGLAIWRAGAGARVSAPAPDADSLRQRLLGLGAVLALAGVLAAIATTDGSDGWLYPYGLLALDGATVLLIATAVLRPSSPAARALSVRPLRALGQISYGLYLWHFPLFLWLTADTVGVSGTRLLLVRLAVTLAVSITSYFLIEQPIRQRRRPVWLIRALTPLAAGGAVAALLLASAADQLPVGIPAAATLPQPPPQLAGNDPSCTVTLKDGSDYGEAPVPESKETKFVYNGARLPPADVERVGREDVPDVPAEAGADGRRLAGVHARRPVAGQRGALRHPTRGRRAARLCVHHRRRARRRRHLGGPVGRLPDRRRALGRGGRRDARSGGGRRARVPGHARLEDRRQGRPHR